LSGRQGSDFVLRENQMLAFVGGPVGRGGDLLQTPLPVVDQQLVTVRIDGDDPDVGSVQNGQQQFLAFPARGEQFPQFRAHGLQLPLLDAHIDAGEPDCERNGQHDKREKNECSNVRRREVGEISGGCGKHDQERPQGAQHKTCAYQDPGSGQPDDRKYNQNCQGWQKGRGTVSQQCDRKQVKNRNRHVIARGQALPRSRGNRPQKE